MPPFATLPVVLATPPASTWRETLLDLVSWALAWLVEGYDIAPGLMLGLAAVLVLPLAAIAALLVRIVSRRRARAGVARLIGTRARGGGAATAATMGPVERGAVRLAGGPRVYVSRLQPLVRIGREDDAELRLPGTHIHRYHAIVYLSQDMTLRLRDVAGAPVGDVLLNGRPIDDAPLVPGDAIDVGGHRLILERITDETAAGVVATERRRQARQPVIGGVGRDGGGAEVVSRPAASALS